MKFVVYRVKKHKFGCKNEHLTAKQIHLWDEAVEEDIATVELELERLGCAEIVNVSDLNLLKRTLSPYL